MVVYSLSHKSYIVQNYLLVNCREEIKSKSFVLFFKSFAKLISSLQLKVKSSTILFLCNLLFLIKEITQKKEKRYRIPIRTIKREQKQLIKCIKKRNLQARSTINYKIS